MGDWVNDGWHVEFVVVLIVRIYGLRTRMSLLVTPEMVF